MNTVTIQTFKQTGKWYEELTYYTNTPVYLWQAINNELLEKFKHLKNFNYSLYISSKNGTVINSRLVINKTN